MSGYDKCEAYDWMQHNELTVEAQFEVRSFLVQNEQAVTEALDRTKTEFLRKRARAEQVAEHNMEEDVAEVNMGEQNVAEETAESGLRRHREVGFEDL